MSPFIQVFFLLFLQLVLAATQEINIPYGKDRREPAVRRDHHTGAAHQNPYTGYTPQVYPYTHQPIPSYNPGLATYQPVNNARYQQQRPQVYPVNNFGYQQSQQGNQRRYQPTSNNNAGYSEQSPLSYPQQKDYAYA